MKNASGCLSTFIRNLIAYSHSKLEEKGGRLKDEIESFVLQQMGCRFIHNHSLGILPHSLSIFFAGSLLVASMSSVVVPVGFLVRVINVADVFCGK